MGELHLKPKEAQIVSVVVIYTGNCQSTALDHFTTKDLQSLNLYIKSKHGQHTYLGIFSQVCVSGKNGHNLHTKYRTDE